MPLYEFRCKKCKIVYNRIQSYADTIPNCPYHGEMYRVIAPATPIFKGKNWARDSYGLHPSAKGKKE